MYGTFGNEEALSHKILERYAEGPSAYLRKALDEPTALGVASAVFAGTIRTTTRPEHPQGCLGVQGALATSDSGRRAARPPRHHRGVRHRGAGA